MALVRLLGIDPGLRFTGWGMLEVDGNRLRHLGDGVIATDSAESVPDRLKVLHDALGQVMDAWLPDEAAVEETYVNRNGTATRERPHDIGIATTDVDRNNGLTIAQALLMRMKWHGLRIRRAGRGDRPESAEAAPGHPASRQTG